MAEARRLFVPIHDISAAEIAWIEEAIARVVLHYDLEKVLIQDANADKSLIDDTADLAGARRPFLANIDRQITCRPVWARSRK